MAAFYLNNGNRTVSVLKIILTGVMSWITFVVIDTSLKSNLFKEWHTLGSIPWMRATLWDFYANVLVLSLIICYKERSIAARIIWIILLVTLGSIATCAYALIQLFKIKPGQGVSQLFDRS